MPAVTIELAWYEVMNAGQAANFRMTEVIFKGMGETHGSQKHDDFQRHMNGALGEIAVAKFLNVYWKGKGDCFGIDIGGGDREPHEVRATQRDDGCLILHPNDRDNCTFWLVTGMRNVWTIQGWLVAVNGKQDRYWRDPGTGRPAYFVPQDRLEDPERYYEL